MKVSIPTRCNAIVFVFVTSALYIFIVTPPCRFFACPMKGSCQPIVSWPPATYHLEHSQIQALYNIFFASKIPHSLTLLDYQAIRDDGRMRDMADW